MKKFVLGTLILLCAVSSVFASETIATLLDANGNPAITNKIPEILAVKESADSSTTYLFVFYRDEQPNDNSQKEQFIIYQYAAVTNGSDTPLSWSKPIKIERDDFRSKQNVAAAYMDGRIYVFGKRDGVRYTSASLEQALNNDWQPWEFLRDEQEHKIESHENVDAVGHTAKTGGEAVTVAMVHKRSDASGNKIVYIYECKANGLKLACGEKSQPNGNDLSKQYWCDTEPTIAFAPDFSSPFERTLYVMWPSDVRSQDNASVSDFLYYRRLHSANERDYYGDYNASGTVRPKDLVKEDDKSLYAKPAVAVVENNGVFELLRQPQEGEKVTRYRFANVDSSKSTSLETVSTLSIKAKSGISAVSVDGKVYAVYQNTDKNAGATNSVNYVVLE